MKKIIIDIPDNLKNNIMFRVIVENKEFSLIGNKIGVLFNKPTKLNETNVIIRDLETKDDKLIFTIEEIEE